MVRCIIVEDERLAQNVIQSHLQKIKQFELIAVCNNVLEAKRILDEQPVDLIFLDIQLPGINGLTFLQNLDKAPLVVITTAYSEYALESYNFNVVDYLLKPISFERFEKATNKIVERFFTEEKKQNNKTVNHIFIKSNGRFFKLYFNEIVYVQAMRDYIKIFTNNSMFITLQTMNEMEKLLPAEEFLRVHKSYIVSTAHIKIINSNAIETGLSLIPVGNNYKEKVMRLIAGKPL